MYCCALFPDSPIENIGGFIFSSLIRTRDLAVSMAFETKVSWVAGQIQTPIKPDSLDESARTEYFFLLRTREGSHVVHSRVGGIRCDRSSSSDLCSYVRVGFCSNRRSKGQWTRA